MDGLHALVDIIARLRGPDGCPWDRKQTLSSMRQYLLEEAHEVIDAVDLGAPHDVEGELGDLLFNVALMARILEEGGLGSLDGAARRIADKMVHRHPHVFGDADRDAGVRAWEDAKRREATAGAQPRGRLAGVPRSLPGLQRTHRQCGRVAADGFDWPDAEAVLRKVEEELAELREALASGDADAIAHEYGDALMALASVGRHVRVNPEDALRTANDRFADRYAEMERIAHHRGVALAELDPDALEDLWQAAKRRCSPPLPEPGSGS